MEELVWDEEFESLAREKAAAEAKWGSALNPSPQSYLTDLRS